MKFLRRYRDYQKFQEEYSTSGTSIEVTAIQCDNGVVYEYVGYEDEDGYVWRCDPSSNAFTETRNPAVGDTALDDDTGNDIIVEAVTANTINGYVEPWVSLTDKNQITVSVLSDNALVEGIPIPSEYTYTYLGEYDIDTSAMMA